MKYDEKNDDSLSETINVLSNPDIMKSLAKSLEDIKKSKTCSIEEV